jgi:hypothetical protein
MSKSAIRLVVLAVLLLALAVADVFVMHAIFTAPHPGANDFYRNWAAARMWWTQGLAPYSPEAAAQIEIGMYAHRATLPTEDPGYYSYPFYTIFLVLPLAFLPYTWAEALWLTLLQFVLIVSVIGTIRVVEWRVSLGLLSITCVWAILFYHSARAILLGQFAVVVFAFVVATLLALRARRDILAGLCLALTMIKPQMVILFVPLVILWAVAQRRWRVVWGAAGTMAVLCGASFIALPSWLGGFMTELMRYTSYTAIGSPVWIVTHYTIPALGAPAEIILSVALVAWAVAMWPRSWHADAGPTFVWTVGVALVVTNLVALRTATTNYVVLFVPLLQIFATAQARWKRAGTWVIVGVEIASLIGLWMLFAATVVKKFEHPIMYLPLPVGLAIVLAAWRTELEKVRLS